MSRNRLEPAPSVSDHAVLRWLERRYGFDVEGERKKIDGFCDAALRAGAKVVKVEGVQFVLKNGRVITTLDGDMATTPRYDKQRLHEPRPQVRG
jgi:hypothetical protein